MKLVQYPPDNRILHSTLSMTREAEQWPSA